MKQRGLTVDNIFMRDDSRSILMCVMHQVSSSQKGGRTTLFILDNIYLDDWPICLVIEDSRLMQPTNIDGVFLAARYDTHRWSVNTHRCICYPLTKS